MNPAHIPHNKQSKQTSSPPPYTEFAGYTSAQPSSLAPVPFPSSSSPPPHGHMVIPAPMPMPMPQVHSHPGYGPTPLGTNLPLLPYAYYAPRESANSRARWRFVGAMFWALMFYSILAYVCLIGGEILGAFDRGQWFRDVWMRVGSMFGDGAVSFLDV